MEPTAAHGETHDPHHHEQTGDRVDHSEIVWERVSDWAAQVNC